MKFKINKKTSIIFISFLVIIAAGVYFYSPSRICLNNNEDISYKINEFNSSSVAVIFAKNRELNKEAFHFQIDNVPSGYSSFVKLRKCGVYVIRMFNFDPKKSKQDPGFKAELWNYDYKNRGNKLIVLSEKENNGDFKSDYSYEFNVDPNENYLVLEQSYLGKDDYSLIIKDLKTLKDVFTLYLKDVVSKYPDVVPGSFGLGEWTADGKELWGDIYEGALDTAYYRIEAGTWKVDVYPTPSDLLAGVERAFNRKGYLAFVDVPTFTGAKEIYDQIVAEARAKGEQKNLFVYNFATKEKLKIAAADPAWQFKPNWIDETELEYYLPAGKKKIFKIE